jgi:hypothetical protein
MPNWCNNVLTLKHNDPAMIALAVKAFEAGNLFNEFIPMPDELQDGNEWSYANWGCKWDVGGSDATVSEDGDPNQVEMAFDSPWSPPVEGYGNLEQLGFEVDAFYYEGGMGFCGRFKAGEDECHEIVGNSAWVRRNIPCEIDEAFSISDNMEEWENKAPPCRRKGGRRMQKLRRLLAHSRSCIPR